MPTRSCQSRREIRRQVDRECRPLSDAERDALLERARDMYRKRSGNAWFICK